MSHEPEDLLPDVAEYIERPSVDRTTNRSHAELPVFCVDRQNPLPVSAVDRNTGRR
jgi:hypothetical protein